MAVIGDFNDTPDSEPLSPLLQEGSDLRDVSQSPAYLDDGRPGTFGNGTKSQKIDYILLSPELFVRVEKAAVFRKGAWGGKNGDLWEHYENMTSAVHAASDHAAIWVELNVKTLWTSMPDLDGPPTLRPSRIRLTPAVPDDVVGGAVLHPAHLRARELITIAMRCALVASSMRACVTIAASER